MKRHYKVWFVLALSLSAATSTVMVGDPPLPKPWWGEPHLPFPVEVYDPPQLIRVNNVARLACMAACNALWWVAGPAAAPAVAACMAACPAAIRD